MKAKKVPQRKCLGCNQVKDKKDLIRVVRSPEGDISVDKTGKKPGRGAYVCPCKECVEKAIANKSLERALEIKIDDAVKQELLAGV
jgi:predicted RNA-binding protein YlxR (DUF448 family)